MDIKNFMFSAREIVSAILIAIIIPVIVHRGVNLMMPRSVEEQNIRNKLYGPLTEQEKEKLNTVQKSRDNVLFVSDAVVGLIIVVIGLIVKVPALGIGLVLGGGMTMTTGYVLYWHYLSDLIIFLSLLLALVVLVIALYRYSLKKNV